MTLENREKIPVEIVGDPSQASKCVANEIASLIRGRGGKSGYRGQFEVDVELEAPSTLPEGEIPFEMEANWQVCSDKTGVCVRGNATLHASMQ